ncbi:hypothetical protein J7643_04630 [bacterium]|nr:hypothetical protein [bacterium]
MKRTAQGTLAQTQRLAMAVLKAPIKPATRFSDVLKALKDGKHRVVIEVPWYTDGCTHQLILSRIAGDRIHFLNTAKSSGRLKQTLPRRKEADGTESARIDDLRQLFESARCGALLLPRR